MFIIESCFHICVSEKKKNDNNKSNYFYIFLVFGETKNK